jgi:hypothetical protein
MSVYFAESCGYLKIGYSAEPLHRAESITRLGTRPDDVPHKADVEVIGWIPGDRWIETQMHGRFTDHRVAGEWFVGIDRDEVRRIIWNDPRGVDIARMSFMAVAASLRWPDLTRDELESRGIPIEGRPDAAMDEVFAR